jgi:hypothetical protein
MYNIQVLTLNMQNRSDSSRFNGYSPLQNCLDLVSLQPSIAHFAYSHHWQ